MSGDKSTQDRGAACCPDGWTAPTCCDEGQVDCCGWMEKMTEGCCPAGSGSEKGGAAPSDKGRR